MPTFDEATHTYTDGNGEKLESVTRLLSEVGISPSYEGISEEVMKKAAERGTMIHEEIHNLAVNGEPGFSKEVQSFQEFLGSRWKVVESEKMVWDTNFAGTLDLVLYDTEADKYYLADIKTTSEPHLKSTSFQTSIYAYLYQRMPGSRKIDGVKMLWFDADGKCRPIDLFYQPDEKIKKVFDCYFNFEKYTEDDTQQEALLELNQVETALIGFKNLMETYEKREAEIKAKLIQAMEANGVYSFENDQIKVTYTKPGERVTFDSTRFKKDEPETYEKYTKVSHTKASVRITIKKKKEKKEE